MGKHLSDTTHREAHDTREGEGVKLNNDETIAPLHVATITVKGELPKYEIIFSI